MDQPEHEILLTRRQVLQAAGLAVAGGAIAAACSDGDDGARRGSTTTTHPRDPSSAATGDGDGGSEPSGAPAFEHLFTPLAIGTFEVRNRILSTAHHTAFGEDGLPSARHRDYWGSKAAGGIGLIVTEVQPIHPTAAILPTMIQCYNAEVVDAFAPVVSTVHEHGARIVAQIWHPGNAYPGIGSELVSSSAIPNSPGAEVPRALEGDEIAELLDAYATAARRMREAGLDGVEIHMGHGYLPQQFMSPARNVRTDDYGGSEENRIRFALEAIDAVRAAIGHDYTVGIRLTADEFMPGGLTLDDMKRITPKLTASGKLDYVNVTLGGAGIISPMGTEHGRYVYLAEGVKEVVDVPVFCIGRIVHPSLAESIVAEGRADVVGMTRANMTDPELPNKAREGRVGEIRHCVGMMACWDRISGGHPDGVTCALNPSVGRETELAITPASESRRVVVVGGGIAGMEAARVAAERGHSVTLYERAEKLGGQLLVAAQAPGREEMSVPVSYYLAQLDRLGIDVRLGAEVTSEMIRSEEPAVVIVATGGRPAALEVPGGNGANVVQGRDVLTGAAPTGDNVVVVAADGSMEGVTTGDFLGAQGKKVEVLRPDPSSLSGIELITYVGIAARLGANGVTLTSGTEVVSIDSRTVVVSTGGAERRIEDVDTVVLSLGSIPDDALLRELDGIDAEVHAVGQCREIGGVLESVTDALSISREI